MRFEHSGKNYRIAFHHAPSRVWADHAGHEVALDSAAPQGTVLWCEQCNIQLSHIAKGERIRSTSCTIYEEITESAGGETKSFELHPVLHGIARPNVLMGDRFGREKGRQVSLANALAEIPAVATREFRAAAWAAYLGRRRNKALGAS